MSSFRANTIGVKKARFPINDLIKGSFKKALNVDTAALMIVGFREYQDWGMTFEKIVPNKFKGDKKQEN